MPEDRPLNDPPTPQSKPDAQPKLPPAVDRRRLLVALGFGAASAAALGRLPDPASREGRLAVQGVQQSPAPAPGADPTVSATPRGTDPNAVGDEADGPSSDVDLGQTFSVVINGGRVIDPDTGLDAVRNVGLLGGTIAAITEADISGEAVIDASNRVVAPGFIDLLSYEPNEYGIWYKVADGVTSNMAMHGVNARAADFVARYRDTSPCHFGGAFDDPFMRGPLGGELDLGVEDAASVTQLGRLVDLATEDLESGLVGINFGLEYTPGVETDEVLALARVAESKGMACYFHARFADPDEPGTNAEAIEEVINVAKETGVSVHIEHISSTGGTHTMAESLDTIDTARDQGYDITACVYPYSFWATTLGSTRFADGWQERFRIDYANLTIPGEPTRVTAENFAELRQQNRLAAAMGAIPEAEVEMALQTPWVMLGSDAILTPANNNHPRSAGTFARTLGRFVREDGVLSLIDALAKMTILPAQRLQGGAPAFAQKGRMQQGMDADITIFDPDTIIDRATVDTPNRESVGVEWVFVDGQAVRAPGGVAPITSGRPLTSTV